MDLNTYLSNFQKEIPLWPPCIDDNSMVYDTEALYLTLQKKEEEDFFTNENLLSTTRKLSDEYTSLAGKINTNAITIDEISALVNYLDNEIENALIGDYKVYASQWGISIKALQYYRKGDLEDAIRLTEECIDSIDFLVKKGVYSFVFRALEQNKNIGIVLAKKGEFTKSDAVKGGILSYLFNGDSKSLYGSCLLDRGIWDEFPYMRECFGYFYFTDYLRQFIEVPIEDQRDKFSAIFIAIENIEVNTIDRYYIHNWIHIEKKFFNQEYTEFLVLTSEFFKDSIHRFYAYLYESLLKKALFIIKKSNYNQQTSLVEQINIFIDNQKKVPKQVRKEMAELEKPK